eukprot:PhF_6_TR32119/c1_g1_i1/m.47534
MTFDSVFSTLANISTISIPRGEDNCRPRGSIVVDGTVVVCATVPTSMISLGTLVSGSHHIGESVTAEDRIVIPTYPLPRIMNTIALHMSNVQILMNNILGWSTWVDTKPNSINLVNTIISITLEVTGTERVQDAMPNVIFVRVIFKTPLHNYSGRAMHWVVPTYRGRSMKFRVVIYAMRRTTSPEIVQKVTRNLFPHDDVAAKRKNSFPPKRSLPPRNVTIAGRKVTYHVTARKRNPKRPQHDARRTSLTRSASTAGTKVISPEIVLIPRWRAKETASTVGNEATSPRSALTRREHPLTGLCWIETLC